MSAPTLQHDDSDEWLDVGLNAGASGGALYAAGNADSSFQTSIGDVDKDAEQFHLAGTHGLFEANHGALGRTITWSGQLRVTTAALQTIRAQRDSFRLSEGVFTFTDDDGTEYTDCTILEYQIGVTAKRPIMGESPLEWVLPYGIVLLQLEP